jgi:lipid II isoglutaminyl synthase (glutamine-hydrolysing)
VGLTAALDMKVAAARAAGALSRRAGRGGTSLPGKLLMRLDPHAIARLAGRLQRGSAVISATNGKTTTAAMAAEILERAGARLVHNRAGANMAGGVATALMDGPRDADTGLFEVDEFWLDRVVADVRPRALLLANLFRDQLDRYGELDTIADRWAQVAATTDTALVLNADDPAVADLGRERESATYFGVEDDGMALGAMQHAADAKHCRRCGAAYRYDAVYLGHLGRYHCDSCGASRPEPQVAATAIVLEGVRSARFTLRTPAGDRAVSPPPP